MSSTAISTLNTDYLQIAISSSSAYQGSGAANSSIGGYGNSLNDLASYTQGSDSGQLSPFAQLVSTLQQVQQQNPAEYQQLTQQIASNLQTAAQTAQTDGNSPQANQLGQLATDFTNAASTGQLPNLQDLAQAVGGSQDQTGGSQDQTGATSGFQSFSESITIASVSLSSSTSAAGASNATSANATTGNTANSSSTDSSSSATGPLSELKQLLQSLLASFTQDQGQSLNPLSIIQNALSNAGISYSNSQTSSNG